MMEGYRRISYPDLKDGMVVILERKHFDYKTGAPKESDYYRTIVGHHHTVGGDAFHLTTEPNWEWPSVPPWHGRWIYAGNGGMCQMWTKEAAGNEN